MNALPATPDAAAAAALPGVSFADAYRIVRTAPSLTAMQAAEAVFNSMPGWTRALMAIRNAVMRPFGVKTSATQAGRPGQTMIGLFPVLRESPRHLLLGFDDSHLDFRITVALDDAEGATAITVTTAVLTHNALGRVYLAAILPFHRLIVRTLLSRARFTR